MVLFVGGIHAVGKTYVLKPVCERMGLRHATASQFIREQRGRHSWDASRQVNEIDENQIALIEAVEQIDKGGEVLVLDGHFALRKSVNVHEKIGLETFAKLNIRGVVLLEAPSTVVAERLRLRGDATWDLVEIETFALAELGHAQTICGELQFPLIRLYCSTEKEVQDALLQLLHRDPGTVRDTLK